MAVTSVGRARAAERLRLPSWIVPWLLLAPAVGLSLFLIVIPYAITFLYAFTDAQLYSVTSFSGAGLRNFSDLFSMTEPSFSMELVTTIAFTAVTVAGSLGLGTALVTAIVSLLGGYALGRYDLRLGRAFLLVFLALSLLPDAARLVPLFLLYLPTGLYDTRAGIILAYAAGSLPLGIWLMAAIIRQISIRLETLERTTTGRGRVADVTAAELCALDTGSWFAPRFGDQRVPFLDAFLDWLDWHPDLGAELDIKANGIGGELAERIAHCAALRMCGVRRRLNVEHSVTRAAARLLPHLTAAPSCDGHDPGG